MDDLLQHIKRSLDDEVSGWQPQPRALPVVGAPRLRTIAAVLIAGFAVIIVAATAVIGAQHGHRAPSASLGVEPSPLPGTIVQAPVHVVADDSGIPGVVAYQYDHLGDPPTPGDLEATHVTGPVHYAVSPPVGGPHNPIWLNCGTYSSTPPMVNAVHDLEHGAIWITYRPDLSDADRVALREDVATQTDVTVDSGPDSVNTHQQYMDLFPYEDQTSPIVLTSWGHQLTLNSPSDPRIQQFIDTFRVAAKYTPEYGSSCAGGTGTPTG